jgi:hypothetical protein
MFQRHVADGLVDVEITHGADECRGCTEMSSLQVFILVSLKFVPGIEDSIEQYRWHGNIRLA